MQVDRLCISGSLVFGITGASKIEFFNFSDTERVNYTFVRTKLMWSKS